MEVCVIGAGVCGLCGIRYFSSDSRYKVTAFELASGVGGVWKYPDGCEQFTANIPYTSPYYARTYRDLMANTPRRITQFSDFPFPDGPELFPHRSEVLQYLDGCAKHYDLSRYVKFRHEVLSVHPVDGKSATLPRWSVTVRNLETDTVATTTFDAVIVCSGRNGKPYSPALPGIENFRGPVIHSSEYRAPDSYRDKTVLVVGANISGNDLICALIPIARKIVVSRRYLATKFGQYPTVLETGNVQTYTENVAVLEDGTEIPIDAVILCTGYHFDFPFLDETCDTEVSRGRVYPLYRHLIHCRYHTLAFVGLFYGLPFVAAGPEQQIMYYKAFLDGKFSLPSIAEMIADTDVDYEERLAKGLPPHHAHTMKEWLWPYLETLGKEAGFRPYDEAVRAMHTINTENIAKIPCTFREHAF